MAFFNNYSKPGKGVEKDEKRPIGFIMYFILLGRKFGSYISLNLMYLLTCIPSIITMFFVISSFVFDIGSFSEDTQPFIMLISFALAVTVAMIFSLSPLSSGFYYILRNYAREEHAWLSDFWGIFKTNMKHSFLTWIIDSLIVILGFFALRIYTIFSLTKNNLFIIPMVILIFAMVVFALSVPYRWTTMVTFESTLGQVYKNSVYFVLGNTWRSLAQFIFSLFFAGAAAICCVLFSVLAYIVIALIGFSAFGLIQAVTIYPVIYKYTNGEQS